MPVFTNIPSVVKQELLTPIDLKQGTAVLRANLRKISNSAADLSGYKRFLAQELRSLLHPSESGFTGIVADNKISSIEIDIIGNPIPKIIFGGTSVDVAVVFNQDAFRIVLERDAAADGSSVEGWILAVVPYDAFDTLPLGGFLIYLIRRIDAILQKTSALSRYEQKMVRLPVNSIGIGRNSHEQESPDEAEVAQPPKAISAPVPVSAPVSAPAPELAQAPTPSAEPVEPTAPAPAEPAPEPEPVPEPEQVADPEPEPTEVDKEDENYKAAASFSLDRGFVDTDNSPREMFDAVDSYSNFYTALKLHTSEIRKELKSASDSETLFAVSIFKQKMIFSACNRGDNDSGVILMLNNDAPADARSRDLSFPVTATKTAPGSEDTQHVNIGMWRWSSKYNRLNTYQILKRVMADLKEALKHTPKAFAGQSDAVTEGNTVTTATANELEAEGAKFPRILPPSDHEAENYLDEHLINWHSGMDDIYALSCNWCAHNKNDVPRETVEDALTLLERYENDPRYAEDKDELTQMIHCIKDALYEADQFAKGDTDSGFYSQFFNQDGTDIGDEVATASEGTIESKIQELRDVFEGSSYEEPIDDLEMELLDTELSLREKNRAITLLGADMARDRDEHWVDSETGSDDEVNEAIKANDLMLGKARTKLDELRRLIAPAPEATAKTAKLPETVEVPKAKLEVKQYEKALKKIRGVKDDTNTSAYNKLEAAKKKEPKVKQDKPKELKIPKVDKTLPTTVGEKEKDAEAEAPKAEKPKNAAKLPKGFEAKAAAVVRKDIPYEGYTIEKRASTRDESIAVFDVTRPDGSHCHEATSLPKAKEYIDKVVKRLGKPATAAAEFDQEFTAEQPTDLERNDMDKDFADVDKNLNNADEVAEGAKDAPEELAPVADEPTVDAPAEDIKVDINTALKFRFVPSEGIEDLKSFIDLARDDKLEDGTVAFVTDGETLRTFVASARRNRGSDTSENTNVVTVYASGSLVPENAAGETEDKSITDALEKANGLDRATALRGIDDLFEAFEKLVKEDTFEASNFGSSDETFKLPEDADKIEEYLTSYAKPSDEGDVPEDDTEETAEASFAMSLASVLAHKDNPVIAAAEVAGILSAFGSDAEAAFSMIESRGLFASARTTPVMETKFYTRKGVQHKALHMTVASETEETLMYIPRTGAYAVASLEELQEEEARG